MSSAPSPAQEGTVGEETKRRLRATMKTAKLPVYGSGPASTIRSLGGTHLPYSTASPIKIAIVTRSDPIRPGQPSSTTSPEHQRFIAQQLIERVLGPVEVVKHCHQYGSSAAGLDEEKQHRLWQQDIEEVFHRVHLLVIVQLDGLATDQYSLFHSAKGMPVNSLLAWIPANDRLFLIPKRRILEHCINPQGFFKQCQSVYEGHPFLELTCFFTADRLYEMAFSAAIDGRSESDLLYEAAHWNLGQPDQVTMPPTIDSTISIMIDPGDVSQLPSQDIQGILRHFLTLPTQEIITTDRDCNTHPCVVLAYEDARRVLSPLGHKDLSNIWEIRRGDPVWTLDLIKACFAKRDGGTSQVREEQIARYWDMRA